MSNNVDCDKDFLKKLIKHFFKGSLQYYLQPEDIELFTWDRQQAFLDATVNNQIVKKYPVNSEFSRLFLKKLIGYLEFRQDVHDDFYNYLCSVIGKEKDKDNFCYRHYIVGNDLITIKETNNMVVNGTTGMRTWQAALVLSDWALCNKNRFDNKKVLELGSGVGFSGITIGKLCNAQSILLTDCHSDVLKLICDNIHINFPNLEKEKTLRETFYRDGQKNLGVINLDWNYTEDLPSDFVPEILIGADIIYDPSLFNPLCNVIKTFFKRNKYMEVYIVNIIRNEDTFNQFLETLDSFHLMCEKNVLTESVFIDWDQDIQRCLLKIKLK